MYTSNYKRRMYSPQFSDMASISVRRFAWTLSKSMPAAIDIMVKLLPAIIDPSKVCVACQVKDTEKYKDKIKEKCELCIFSKQVNPDELAALEAAI